MLYGPSTTDAAPKVSSPFDGPPAVDAVPVLVARPRLASCWRKVKHVSGEYSVARFLAWHQYCNTASWARVLLVCTLMPALPLAFVVALNAVPLNAVRAGVWGNPGFLATAFVSDTVFSFCGCLLVRYHVGATPQEYPLRALLVIGAITSVAHYAFALVLMVYWRFPVPFQHILGTIPWAVVLVLLA